MSNLPRLMVDDWEDSKNTLHLFMQIVGKIRLKLFPKQNHWWHVPLYVSCQGITTRSIPCEDKLFDITFDFNTHQLVISCSTGESRSFPLEGQSVSSFYSALMTKLNDLGIQVTIKAEPYDVPFSHIPFAEDTRHASYDPDAISRYWQILMFVNTVFEQFHGEFIGKSTPVHLFWHHADLALTRFNGKPAPELSGGTKADKEAYSHEVISFGFWMGDAVVREPAFYAYLYPEPDNLAETPLTIPGASWNTDFGYAMLYCPFEQVRLAVDPAGALLNYLHQGYDLLASAGDWQVEQLRRT